MTFCSATATPAVNRPANVATDPSSLANAKAMTTTMASRQFGAAVTSDSGGGCRGHNGKSPDATLQPPPHNRQDQTETEQSDQEVLTIGNLLVLDGISPTRQVAGIEIKEHGLFAKGN